MVRLHWGNNLMTLGHGKMALVMVPFMLFGFVSGQILTRKGPHQAIWRIIHGLNNTLLMLLAINQARLGLKVYRLFLTEL